MANSSILAAFERMWQHVVAALVNKADINHSHDDVYKKNEIDSTLNTINTEIDGSIKDLSVSGKVVTYTKNDGTTGTITTQDTVTPKTVWYGTCSTAVSTSTKVVTTDSDFTLTEGNILFVTFSNPNTATSMSLNVNGLGSRPVDNASSTSSYGYLMCFVYNGARFVMSDLQSATTSKYGVTKLSSATNSTSTTLAATASAVKSAYDLANTANTAANGKAPTSHASTATTYGAGTGSNYGHVKLSDSTSTTSGASAGVAATPTAVKAAYDLANTANTAASNAATTASAAQTTAEAAQVTADNASAAATAAMPKSGGTFTGTVKAKNNTSYTTGQIRNGMLVAEGASIPAGANGDLCFTYEA